ncbi:Small heat shock protein HSP [Parasponia andersonii]|uniref:Small heat shock protein HSP n=1 Tax=Parasponia andersonii TaxID=3476 RepID=A0A2P5DEL8_PARAD|nr:Small heat shock protein HSP [Parasponia andersonii]
MDFRSMGFEPSLVEYTLHDLLDITEEATGQTQHAPSRAYVRDAKALAATPADVKEHPNTYVFAVDMPGLKPDQIKVHVEDDNVLVVSGERRREKERDQGIKYIRMERRLGKYLKKFVLPENADTDKISATYQDGVLTVTIEKKPPPEPKQPKTIDVQVG